MSKHHQATPARRAHGSCHLFLSYARADNLAPVNASGEGWVSAFVNELQRRHAAYSGRTLQIFSDQDSIEEGVDWKHRLGEGLRQSRLFLDFFAEIFTLGDERSRYLSNPAQSNCRRRKTYPWVRK